MKIKSFEQAADAIADGTWVETVVMKPEDSLLKSEIEGVTDLEYTEMMRRIEDKNSGLYDAAWELIKEEAELVLRNDPYNEEAQKRLLEYAQRQRVKATPAKPGSSGRVIHAKVKTKLSDRRIGVWKKTRSGWLVSIAKRFNCVVGDVVEVKMKGGVIQKVLLVEDFGDGYFKVQNL